ncbi:MAG: peptidoglycan DD-metalloendopeptidase family protein [Chloroflexi bacterium]|nr:peptidoglycan DD-metalloendopeptidase family protein [Chloroflexota bacterium]
MNLAGRGLLEWLRLLARSAYLLAIGAALSAVVSLGALAGWLTARWDHAEQAAAQTFDSLVSTAWQLPSAEDRAIAADQLADVADSVGPALSAVADAEPAQSTQVDTAPAPLPVDTDASAIGASEGSRAAGNLAAPTGSTGAVAASSTVEAAGPDLQAMASLRAQVSDPRDVPSFVLAAVVTPSDLATTMPPAPAIASVTHVVLPGETLSDIAVWYQVDQDAIAEANQLADASLIVPGQQRVVPGGRQTAPRPAATAVSKPTAAPKPTARPVIVAAHPPPMAAPPTAAPTRQAPPAPTPTRALVASRAQAASLVAPRGLSIGPLIWPVTGSITQRYGENGHPGVDVGASTGTPIRAAASGTVIVAAKLPYGYGWRIILDHGNGITTLYAHMSAFNVNQGDRVTRGQTLGAVGATGLATGPHLHFEVASGGKTMDPGAYLP